MRLENTDVYGLVSMNQVGQIIIPKDARKKFGVEQGDHILINSHSHSNINKHKQSDIELILIKERDFYRIEPRMDEFPGYKRFCKHIETLGTSKIGNRGQLVIPKEAREKLGIKPNHTFFMLGFQAPNNLYHIMLIQPNIVKKFAMELLSKLIGFEKILDDEGEDGE